MTVLLGGMRVLDANYRRSELGVFTKRPGTLTNDFFVNLLDMGTEWQPTSEAGRLRGPRSQDRRAQVDRQPRRSRLRFELAAPRDRGGLRVRATRSEKFVRDFVAAWNKVMNLDRFDLA